MNPRLTVNSNINFQSNESSQLEDQHFTLWNAGMNYRFLKEKTLEFKFTALDMLRQNKGISNSGNLNGVTRTTSNVLQLYFMCTLAYYPRKIGK